ncbi:MAG: hypothetical protein FWG68_06415 [Defluviitaleaceae bacterium]|nr:hypothetical protein [Defluviitaleaceae bacterium]
MNFEIMAIKCTSTGDGINLVCAPNCSVLEFSRRVRFNNICPTIQISPNKAVINTVCGGDCTAIPAGITINGGC